jgi:folate-binding protein YgfZ
VSHWTAVAPDDGYGALQSGLGARMVDRDVLSVSGPDARSYLQGQCSQDLDPLGVGESVESLILSPQGKIDAYVRISRTGEDRYVLDMDAGCGDDARARLERFRLRTKVAIEPLEWACLSVRGPEAAGVAAGVAVTELVLPVVWTGWSGTDLLGPRPADDPDLVSWMPAGAVRCGVEAWESARIAAGVPVGGREVTGSTIAAEVGLVDRTVSFTKGCFTGQELVARLDARGSKVARSLSGVVVPDGPRPPVGSAVWTADGEHEVGTLSSLARSPGTGVFVGLATLHRRVIPPAAVVVRWNADGTEVEVAADARPLPLAPGT